MLKNYTVVFTSLVNPPLELTKRMKRLRSIHIALMRQVFQRQEVLQNNNTQWQLIGEF